VITDPYINAVLRLSGHHNFQAFERFCTVLARLRWAGYVVRKTNDIESLFDILVYDVHDTINVIAQIECKASSRQKEIKTIEKLSKLIKKEWKPEKLIERMEELNRSSHPGARAYLATTVRVKPGLWESASASFGLGDLQLWDAHQLGTAIAQDPRLATYLDPTLPNADSFLLESSLTLIVASETGGGRIGVPDLREILSEPEMAERLDFSSPILLYGPPNVGKTCFAVRQAWLWIQDNRPNSNVFIFNARWRQASDVLKVPGYVQPKARTLLVIDDIHFASDPADWMISVQNVAERLTGRLAVLWVSRDPSVRSELSRSLVKPIPFPVERVLSLFLDRLRGYSKWEAILAAFETRLDPRMAKLLVDRGTLPAGVDSLNSASSFCAWLTDRTTDNIRRRQLRIYEQISDAAYHVYLALLPFGSIGSAVETAFIKWLVLRPR